LLNNYTRLIILLTLLTGVLLSSCSKLGYGVLLWSIDDPPIDSGTVLPVYIRSNIEKIWVVGVPETLKSHKDYKKEIPLTQLEFVGNKRKAQQRALEFSDYALTYAENLQDKLPIRDDTDNNARQVYRLRLGEIVKILNISKGNPPISTTGEPLPGDWYRVLTSDGTIGFCFSYRLKLFDQHEGSVQPSAPAQTAQRESAADPELDSVLSRIWSAEIYSNMLNTKRFNIAVMEKKYRFDPGQETGIARVILPEIEKQFNYQKIVSEGERAWRFEGSDLQMVLRSHTTLVVQFADNTGAKRSFLFVNMPSKIEDLVLEENARRETQFLSIYEQGPVFTSNNYGTITFLQTGDFTWTGYDLLVPQVISADTKGAGRINMDLYISPSYEERFTGAFSMRFSDIRSNNTIYFLYAIDNQGLRLEAVPDYGIEDVTVMRRASSPVVLYFFKDTPF